MKKRDFLIFFSKKIMKYIQCQQGMQKGWSMRRSRYKYIQHQRGKGIGVGILAFALALSIL